MTLPDGYVALQGSGAAGFARAEDATWAAHVLDSEGTFHAWAATSPDAGTRSGRATVYVVPHPGGDRPRLVVRHYHRGGWMAPLLGDRYLAVGVPRPTSELLASQAVRGRGIDTPVVVAGAVYPDGLFYRADLVTELSGGVDLAEVLWGGDPPMERDGRVSREGALQASGRFVRALETAGVKHPDLNAKNLLVRSGPDGPEVCLLDLDRCRLLPEGHTAPAGPLRARLRRSLRKMGRHEGRMLSRSEWAALDAGLGERT